MRNFVASILPLALAVMPLSHARASGQLPADAAKVLDGVIAEIAKSDPTVPGVVAAVSAPRLGIEWQGATGLRALGGTEELHVEDAFRIASITKIYVSATILRLIEQKKLGLFDPIAGHISDRTRQALISGGYDPDALTIYHMMTHTNGIYDLSSSPEYLEASASNVQRHWTRPEQIDFAMKYGKPMAMPGREYHYSDTAYIILGEIIERATGQSMGEAMAEQLEFSRLGLVSTYLEKSGPAQSGERRAHQYYGTVDYTEADPSFDLYGGGGLVSTVQDLVRFIRPLMQGDLFEDRSTMAMALMVPPTENGRLAHAPLLGLVSFGKRKCWWHAGFWGEYLIYCPDNDVAVALSWGQALPNEDARVWQMSMQRMAAAIEHLEQR